MYKVYGKNKNGAVQNNNNKNFRNSVERPTSTCDHDEKY